MPLNKWGAFICDNCAHGNHHGVVFAGLCQCTCDGRHDTKGRVVETKP